MSWKELWVLEIKSLKYFADFILPRFLIDACDIKCWLQMSTEQQKIVEDQLMKTVIIGWFLHGMKPFKTTNRVL